MPMTQETVVLLVRCLEKMDEIKSLSNKFDLLPKQDLPCPDWVMPFATELVAQQKIKTLEDLDAALDGYLALIPAQERSFLTKDVALDRLTSKFYNELPLGRAEAFVEALQKAMKGHATSGDWALDLYDFGDQISLRFPSQKAAKAFFEVYGQPCTVLRRFKGEDGAAWTEIDCW